MIAEEDWEAMIIEARKLDDAVSRLSQIASSLKVAAIKSGNTDKMVAFTRDIQDLRLRIERLTAVEEQ